MNIGLIAHDGKKKLMQNCCAAYRGVLARHQLYATGTTGRLIEEATGLSVHKLLAGHVGGEQQIGARYRRRAPLEFLSDFVAITVKGNPFARRNAFISTSSREGSWRMSTR